MNIYHGILGLLLLQLYVSAAPSNITDVEQPITKIEDTSEHINQKSLEDTELEETNQDGQLEDNVEVEPEEPKLDSQPPVIEDSKLDDQSSTQSPRQKRFYNFFAYGAPPINPIVYPGYNKRDQSAEIGVYGIEDPLEQIHRRLHDIASFVRQPAPPPPPPSHFPFFFPVIYIPQFGCDCNSGGNPRPENPQVNPPNPGSNQTDPEPDKRFPELSDDRQNWGFVNNETNTDVMYDEDEFARPISFEPLQPSRPNMRPAPPVEHGSSQGDSTRPQFTTSRPQNPTSRPSNTAGSFASSQTPYPPSFSNDIPRREQPTACDGAVLSCCHRPYLTYDCFVNQGCPDLRSYGNPCEPSQISRVIDKFQKYYGVRN